MSFYFAMCIYFMGFFSGAGTFAVVSKYYTTAYFLFLGFLTSVGVALILT